MHTNRNKKRKFAKTYFKEKILNISHQTDADQSLVQSEVFDHNYACLSDTNIPNDIPNEIQNTLHDSWDVTDELPDQLVPLNYCRFAVEFDLLIQGLKENTLFEGFIRCVMFLIQI